MVQAVEAAASTETGHSAMGTALPGVTPDVHHHPSGWPGGGAQGRLVPQLTEGTAEGWGAGWP